MGPRTKALIVRLVFLTVLGEAFMNCSSKVGFSADASSKSSAAPPVSCTGFIGSISGVVQNATNHDAMSGVSVSALNAAGQAVASAVSVAGGSFTLSNVPPGTYSILASASGFITFDSGLNQTIGCADVQMSTLALSPVLAAGQYRVVLTWTGPPVNWSQVMNTYTTTVMDVDGYLLVPGYSTPVYWGNCNQIPDPGDAYVCNVTGAQLDVDDRDFDGPETITVTTLNTTGTYTYYVANYSDPCNADGLANSLVKITVYSGSNVVKSYSIPPSAPPAGSSGMVFEVFTMTDGQFTDILQYNDALPIDRYNGPATCSQYYIQ